VLALSLGLLDFRLQPVVKIWLTPQEFAHKLDQVLAAQRGKQVFWLRPFDEEFRLVDICEKQGDDMLAIPAPIVGTGTGSGMDAGFVQSHLKPVAGSAGTFAVGNEEIAQAGGIVNGTAVKVLLAALETLRRAGTADHGFSQVDWGGHGAFSGLSIIRISRDK
jgi:hypothetical protein